MLSSVKLLTFGDIVIDQREYFFDCL